jgi:uncharacterized protein YjbI with pentapeptide repeats
MNTNLSEVDFSQSRFKEVYFLDCDLRKADFTDAVGYNINIFTNRVEKAVFSLPEVISLLKPLNIVIK